MYILKISEAAYDDMHESSSWYDEQKSGLGKQFLREVFGTISRVENYPLIYAIKFSGQFHFARVHRFPFLIVYELTETEIIINAVFHTSRNPHKF